MRESPWSAPGTVAGFAQSPPNAVLMRFAGELRAAGAHRALDLGCGAARNAVPLAEAGWEVFGLDDSMPMLDAAARRARAAGVAARVRLACATMDRLPVRAGSFDLVIAHGIWNLARDGEEFRRAVREAAAAASPGAGLFVFTFSRNTFGPEAPPVPGESFVFTQFSGSPQVFLTGAQLVTEMAAAGFEPHPSVPLTEYNRPPAGALRAGGPPVIYEAAFRLGA
ncbi:MAG: methyltransferase domain-containing protein [Candidatus Eisenbacteria bacterium]|nr:methyltransferase domain-containing protein [Candidatus Eisenbacteria bacterium]